VRHVCLVLGYLHSDDVVRWDDSLAAVRLARLPPEKERQR
jgi:hypothetical protein